MHVDQHVLKSGAKINSHWARTPNKSKELRNASLFTKCLFTILVPLYPPLPINEIWISSKREKKTSNIIANTEPEWRTNSPKVANKQNYERKGVSEKCLFVLLLLGHQALSDMFREQNRAFEALSGKQSDLSRFRHQLGHNFAISDAMVSLDPFGARLVANSAPKLR